MGVRVRDQVAGVYPENLKVRQVESPSILVARHSRGCWEGGEEARECTVRGWIRKIVLERRRRGKGGTIGPTKDRIMTKDETEDCADKKADKTDDKKAEPGAKQTRTLKKT